MLSPDHLWAAKITRRILLDCHPWQLDGVRDPSRRTVFCVGRGGAKTTTKRARALIKLIWLRNQYVGYAATTADHARELNWNKIKDACEAYGLRTNGDDPDVSFLETKMRMTCHRTGSVYRLRGVEDTGDAEKFRGFPQAEFQVDECGSFSPELLGYLLTQCVAPRLGEALALPPGLLDFLVEWDEDPDELAAFLAPVAWDDCRGGCITLGSTPPAQLRGEFYEVTREGSKRHRPYAKRNAPEYKGWRGYSSHFWTLKDVVDLPKARMRFPALVANWEEALIEKAEKQWSDDNPIWKREYLGIWAADDTDTVFRYRPHVEGKPWNQWDPVGRVASDFETLRQIVAFLRGQYKDVRFVLAGDEGHKDPFALNVFAFSPTDALRNIWHVFAYERTEMYAKLVAELVVGEEAVAAMMSGRGMPNTYGGVFGAIGGWPDGLVMDGDETYLAELANVYGLRFVKADRRQDAKVGAIELTNGDLVDGRIKILKDSPLEKQILVLQWKEDDFGRKKEDKAQANHSTDTLIYGCRLIQTLFSSGAVVQEAKGATATQAWLEGPAGEIPSSRRDEFAGLLTDPSFGDSDGW